MKQIAVTDGAARLIEWLRTDEGMNVTNGWLCTAFRAQIEMMGGAEDLSGDDMLPLQVMAKYGHLVEELSVTPRETITFNDNQNER